MSHGWTGKKKTVPWEASVCGMGIMTEDGKGRRKSDVAGPTRLLVNPPIDGGEWLGHGSLE